MDKREMRVTLRNVEDHPHLTFSHRSLEKKIGGKPFLIKVCSLKLHIKL